MGPRTIAVEDRIYLWLSAIILFISLIIAGREEAYGRRYFFIKRPTGSTTYAYEFLRDATIRPGRTILDKTTVFTQRLNILTDGWIYLPGLCSFTIRVEPEWERERNNIQTGKVRKQRRSLRGYDLEAIFLKDKPYTLGLYTNQDNSKLKSNFAPRTVTETRGYGGYLRLKYQPFLAGLRYGHTETDQEGTFATEEERDNYRVNIQHMQGPSISSLEYELEDHISNFGGSTNTGTRSDLTLRNRYTFREKRKIWMDSSFRYLDISEEESKRKSFTWTEDLSWTHRDNLTTKYHFTFERVNEEDSFSERKDLAVSLTHRLYENLTTTISLSSSFDNFTGGEEKIYNGTLDLSYRRRIPWGMLNINTAIGYKINDQDNDLLFSDIIDESHILSSFTFTFLEHENVVLESIVVTDLNDHPYIEGIDYRIRQLGQLVEIIRIPFGRIANGEEVLIDYTIRNNPPIKFSTTRQAYGFQLYLWRKWRLYYRYNRAKQRFIAGYDTGNLVTDTIQLVGTEFKWRWSQTRFEFEERNTTNIPSQNWFIEQVFSFRPVRTLYFSLSAQYREAKFKDTGEADRTRRFRSRLRWYLTDWALLEAEALYERAKGVHWTGEERNLSSSLQWTYAAWEGKIEFSFLREKDFLGQRLEKNIEIMFEITRNF